jgi:hypothetical protein
MSHQPFELWLLEDQNLEPEQKRALQAHLQTCVHCSALVETGSQLRSVRQAEPASGFSVRFQQRLSAHKLAERRRKFWGMILFVLGGLGLLGWFAGPILSPLLASPAEWIALLLSYVFFIVASVQALSDVGLVLVRVVPGFVPPFAWLVITSALAGVGLLWIISIWRLTYVSRGAYK